MIALSTRLLIGDLFDLADLGAQPVKGFEEPVRAWRVLGDSPAESRFEALHGQNLTPFIGREHEIGFLFERFERAKDGEGQVVLLSGEPGIGKSRTVRALRERLQRGLSRAGLAANEVKRRHLPLFPVDPSILGGCSCQAIQAN